MIIERPTYLAFSGSDDMKDAARQIVARAPGWAGPMAGVVGGAVVGALAAYFVPKVLDRVLVSREPTEYDLDIEP